MARLSALAPLILFAIMFITLSSFVSNSEGRNFLVVNNNIKDTRSSTTQDVPSSSLGSLFLSVLPKGNVPSSAPSKKGHAVVVNEKLIARHLIAVDRSLQSVPSPGVGH